MSVKRKRLVETLKQQLKESAGDENTPSVSVNGSLGDSSSRKRSRSWMYTINNYDDNTLKTLKHLECNYHVWGLEVGECGTPHVQGCITFTKTHTFNSVRKLIKGHVEVPRDLEAARNYCKKDGNFEIVDNRKRRGTRTDLSDVVDFIKAGNSVRETAAAFSEQYVKYHRGLEQLILRTQQDDTPRTTKPIVHWYYGATGTGKTRSVIESEKDLWITSAAIQYCNGYTNQPAVLFDDFRGDMCKFRELLRLTDRYPGFVNIKYGYAQWNPKRIYFTCAHHPTRVYNRDDHEDIEQLLRRIDHIVRFDGNYRSPDSITIVAEKGEYLCAPGTLPKVVEKMQKENVHL